MPPFLDIFGLLSRLLGPHADPAPSQHWVLRLTHSDHSAKLMYIDPHFPDEETVAQRVPQIPTLMGKACVQCVWWGREGTG